MKLKYSTVLKILFFSFQYYCLGQSPSCTNEILKSEWNMSICISKTIAIDISQPDIMIVKNQIEEGESINTRILTISSGYNSMNITIGDLWEKHFGNRYAASKSKPKVINDTVYSKDDVSYLIKAYELEEATTYLTAVILYKNRYYLLNSFDKKNRNGALAFFKNIIERIKFYGDIKPDNDFNIEQTFLNSLASNLSNKEDFKKLLINYDILKYTLKGEDPKELESIKSLIKDWNNSAYKLNLRFDSCNSKISIEDTSFNRLRTLDSIDNLICSMTINCGEKNVVNVRFTAFQISDQIYLGKVIIE